MKQTYNKKLFAVFELHTFSSLNKEFLPLYKDAMKYADKAVVFYNKSVFAHKRMEVLDKAFVKQCFGEVEIINNVGDLEQEIDFAFKAGNNILLMSSGKFEGAEFIFD